jgi:hypothetical protein
MNLGPVPAWKSGFAIRWSLIKANPYASAMNVLNVENSATNNIKDLANEHDGPIKPEETSVNQSPLRMILYPSRPQTRKGVHGLSIFYI